MTKQETVRFWLDQEAEGELSAADAARLGAALSEHRELEGERADLERLHDDLRLSRVAVREGFRDSVMNALPTASWEPVGKQRWGVAIGIAAALVVVSGLLLALAGGTILAPGIGVLAALGEFFRTTAITGAGLLGASWRGLGLALQKALEGSPVTFALFGVGVLALNLLFFRLLRRNARSARPALESPAASAASPTDEERRDS